MAQEIPLLRPLNLSDLLDTTLRLYRHNFATFLGITAVVYVPVGIVQVIAACQMGVATNALKNSPDAPAAALAALGLPMLSLVLVALLAVPICQGALSVAVARRYLGQPTSIEDAYGTIGSRWGMLIAATLLVALMVIMGTFACILPGIYLAIMLMFVPPVIVLEGLPVIQSLERSWNLVKTDTWRILGTYFLLSLIVGIIGQAVSVPVTLISAALWTTSNPVLSQAIPQGFSAIVTTITQPVLVIGLVLLYYDVRVRTEGFDVQILAQALGTATPVYAPPPPPATVTELPPAGTPDNEEKKPYV